MSDAAALLAAHDAQVRARIPEPLPDGVTVELDGPLVRMTGVGGGGFVVYRDLAGLAGAALDELIERQVRFFDARGERFEWKLYGHDRPDDLPERLRRHGFRPEAPETVVIGPVDAVAGEPHPPDGVVLRETATRRDLDRIAVLEERVWNESTPGLSAELEAELAADPRALAVVVAEAGAEMVSAGWIRFEAGTDFATLWGGSTLAEWRRRGIYRALVAYRASLALERGYRLLQVDASEESRPILERLGFVAVGTTTPYVWMP